MLHTALAELFVQLAKYDEAMHHYSAALEYVTRDPRKNSFLSVEVKIVHYINC